MSYSTSVREWKRLSSKLLSDSKRRARKKNIPHSISLEDIRDIDVFTYTPYMGIMNCRCCLKQMRRGIKVSCKDSPTLDRIHPDKGYVKGNIKVICRECNNLKGSSSTQEEIVQKATKLLFYVKSYVKNAIIDHDTNKGR